jgi:hypothetical protein
VWTGDGILSVIDETCVPLGLLLTDLGRLVRLVILLSQPVEERCMPQAGGADLAMLIAAGFAVEDLGCHAACVCQALLECTNLIQRHEMIVGTGKNQYVTRDA